MKRTNHTLLALVTCASMLALTGCGDSKHVAEVKALPFNYPGETAQDPNLTVDQALDYRRICASTKWQTLTTEQHQIVVQYDCTYKGVADSLFIANDKANGGPNLMYPDKIGDLYQWTYGVDGKSALSYVALHYHFPNGTTKDIRSSGPIASDGDLNVAGVSWVVMLMEEAIKENIQTYDQFRADVYGVRIPNPPAAQQTKGETSLGSALASAQAAGPAAPAQPGAPTQPASSVQPPAPMQTTVPADDPRAIAQMITVAQLAANANPNDPNDDNAGQLDGTSNPTNEPLWAGKPRSDGYPNYAVTCDFNKQVCTFLNGMGNPLEDSIADFLGSPLTVMRNADVVSGKYTCRHGICVDAQMNLVGRVSTSMAQADSAVMR